MVPGVPVVAGTLAQQCRVTDRIQLLFARLAALGCPDIVTLQEVLDRLSVEELVPTGPITRTDLTSVRQLIQDTLTPFAQVCGFPYRALYAAELVPLQDAPVF